MKSVIFIVFLLFGVTMSGCGAGKSIESQPNTQPNVVATPTPQSTKMEVNNTKPKESISPSIIKKRPIICVDAGHQRKANLNLEPNAPGSKIMKAKVSAGTQGITTKKPEYQLTLEVALKLEQTLKSDYDVIMIRRSNDVNISDSERAIMCNEAHADLMMRLHGDGNDNPQVKGMTFFYPAANNMYTKTISKPSLEFAKIISDQILIKTKAKSNGIKSRDDLTGFNWLKVPSILIEMGFMSNKSEDLLLSTSKYQDKIVSGIKNGLDAYYLRH
jgi:N-acetylmuramoyl-L-alanine amidase